MGDRPLVGAVALSSGLTHSCRPRTVAVVGVDWVSSSLLEAASEVSDSSIVS